MTALALVVQLGLPALIVRAQDEGNCDDLASQLQSTNDELDQLQQQSGAWLAQASQFAAVVPSDLLVAAQNGAPDLSPEVAATLGATALQLGANIDAWRVGSHDAYWDGLANNLGAWEGIYASLVPFMAYSGGLAGLGSALTELDQLVAREEGDAAQRDSLSSALADCQAHSAPSPEAGGGPAPDGALCDYGGKTGVSNSDCFSLAMDAAYSVWEACTLAYFDAERQASIDGGDPPANTCDPAWNAQIEAIQRQWGSPGP
jgi:hypothetical protein